MDLILDDESSTSCVSKLSGPPLRFLRCSLVGMLNGFLRGKAPAFEIITNRANRNLDSKVLLDELLNSVSCPKRKVHFELVRRFLEQALLDTLLLGHIKSSVGPHQESNQSLWAYQLYRP